MIRAGTEKEANGKRLILAAHDTARKAMSKDLANNPTTAGLTVPEVPDVVRLAHIQNHGTNVILFNHYEAMKMLAESPNEPTIEDYKKAFDSVKLPAPGHNKDSETYMEGVRKQSSEELSSLEPQNYALNYHNPDIAYPPSINPDTDHYPLAADVSKFLHEKCTSLSGGSLVTTAARFIDGVSNSKSEAAGMYFNSRQDTIDVHVAKKGQEPPLKAYHDDAMYSDEVYEKAQARGE